MKINSLKDLKAIIDLCRKTGVSTIEVEGLKLQLGPVPFKQTKAKPYTPVFLEESIKVPQFQGYSVPADVAATMPQSSTIQQEALSIATEELSEEQLLFYSADTQETEELQ